MRFSPVKVKMCPVVFAFAVLTFVFALQAGSEQYPLPEMEPRGLKRL